MAASSKGDYDAVVVGSGPNGLAAAIELARHGRSVLVVEADDEIGGGARTRELTRPGALHDVCSAVHPLAASSPFFASLPLERHGLEWLHPPVLAAHPLEGESAAVLQREVATTAAELGADGARYRQLVEPLVDLRTVVGGRVGPRMCACRTGQRHTWTRATAASRGGCVCVRERDACVRARAHTSASL